MEKFKDVIFWIVFGGILVGAIVAGSPINGAIGCAGLYAVACSFMTRKDGGEDRRFKPKTIRAVVGWGCIILALVISMLG